MIEFFGMISDECEKIIAKKKDRVGIVCLLVASIFSVICTIISYFVDFEFFKLVLPCSIILIIVTIIVPLSRTKNRQKQISKFKTEIRITIDGEDIINTTIYGQVRKSLKQVKKVIDAGEWYYVVFKGGNIANSWICQKNLLIKGTLKEFEEKFEHKIIN